MPGIPRPTRRVVCYYDTLTRGDGPLTAACPRLVSGQYPGQRFVCEEDRPNLGRHKIASRTMLFGATNLGYLALSNMEAAGQVASDYHFSIGAIRNVLRFSTPGLLERVQEDMTWTLSVAEHPEIGGWATDLIVPFRIPVQVPPRQHFDVCIEFWNSGLLQALNDDPGFKLIRFELHGEQERYAG